MTVTDWVFLVAAAATLVGAWRVVMSQKIMHAALWLGFTFIGVAAIFLILGADFLAAAQILVYVGAITTIIIFGIMLSAVEDLRGPVEGSIWQRFFSQFATPRKGIFALLAGAGFAVLMMILYTQSSWPAAPGPEVLNTPRLIGEALFRRFVVPFEVASVILLVAFLGAIVLTTREEESK